MGGRGILLWSTLIALVADQASKYLVVHHMGLARVQSIEVLPPLLNFRYGENRGINFGLLNGAGDTQRWILIALSVAVALGVAIWVARGPGSRLMQLGAGLLIGGALGNVVDRLIYGYVLDFLNMSCCGIHNPFVFNVADIFIFLGAAVLILADMRGAKRPAKKGR